MALLDAPETRGGLDRSRGLRTHATQRSRSGRPFYFLLIFLVLLFIPRAARAWVEVHVLADEARVALATDGRAKVEHRITLKVGGGPLRSLELRGVDRDAVPTQDGYVVVEREARAGSMASASPITVERVDPADGDPAERAPAPDAAAKETSLLVRFDGRDVARGTFVLVLRYTTDLAGRGLVKVDGALSRVEWRGPIWDDGYESARTIFELPPAPTAPRVDDSLAGDGTEVPTVLSTVRRTPDKDEIELVRPYAPQREALVWTIRVDPHALRDRVVRAPQPPVAPREPRGGLSEPWRRGLWIAGGIALFVVFASLVAAKSRQVARHAKAAGVAPRPLVPLPAWARALLGAAALTAGVIAQVALEQALAGSMCVAAAVALAAHRTPEWARGQALRGPGRWLPISEAEAYRRPPAPRGASLDVSTRAGRALLALSIALFAAATAFLYLRASHHDAWMCGLDFVVVLALLGTGRLRELPPDPAVAPAPFFERVGRRVQRAFAKREPVRIVPRIRVPEGQPDADEMRLWLAPSRARPGFVAVEIGVVYVPGAGGAIGLPEILLRVHKGSDCDRAIDGLARFGRSMRGRKPDERVIAFSPRLPTARFTADLAAAVVARVRDPGASAEGSGAPEVVRPARRAA
jgi:hypothetical protein